MSRYDACKSLETLADMYGNDMRLYGMSQYWTSPRVCEDTTNELVGSKIYNGLSMYDKSQLLTYGQQMKQYGMGCYAERGACAELYNKYVGTGGIPNPFKNRVDENDKESFYQPGM